MMCYKSIAQSLSWTELAKTAIICGKMNVDIRVKTILALGYWAIFADIG